MTVSALVTTRLSTATMNMGSEVAISAHAAPLARTMSFLPYGLGTRGGRPALWRSGGLTRAYERRYACVPMRRQLQLDGADLGQQEQVLAAGPVLVHQTVVTDAVDVDVLDVDLVAGALEAEEVAGVDAGEAHPDDGLVAVGERVDVVPARLGEHGVHPAGGAEVAGGAAGGAGRGLVVDEAGGDQLMGDLLVEVVEDLAHLLGDLQNGGVGHGVPFL